MEQYIDQLTDAVARFSKWLLLLAVAFCGINVVAKLLHGGSNFWLEGQWYAFSAVFLLGAPYALKEHAHVKIDVLTQKLAPKTRLYTELLCYFLLFFPFVFITLYYTWPYFIDAYISGEQSQNSGGLVRWPARLLIILGFGLLALQGIAECIKLIKQLSAIKLKAFTEEVRT